MKRTAIMTAALFVALTIGAAPFGHAQIDPPMTTLLEVSLGQTYFEDFEGDDGEWTASPVAPAPRPAPVSSWAWGAPTSGPGFAASGDNVWATNLDGLYGATECAAILSPPIDLGDATSASVSFQQWRHTEQSAFGSQFIADAGRLYVTSDGGDTFTVVDPNEGYNGPVSITSTRRCHDDAPSTAQFIGGPPGTAAPPAVYSTLSADLSAFLGATVQFVISFASSSSTHRAGWYIDDFTTTIDGVATTEDFEASDGGFSVVTTSMRPTPGPVGWSWDQPTSGPPGATGLWATNPHGNYGNAECAWTESPPIELGPVPDLPTHPVRAKLSWDHWFRSNSVYAAGVVQIGVVGDNATAYHYIVPEGGYGGDADTTYADQLAACLGDGSLTGAYIGLDQATTAPMVEQLADVSAFVGNTITVRFLFASAWSLLNPSLNPGWYIDNVAIEMLAAVSAPDVAAIVNEATPQPEQAPLWRTGGSDPSWAYGAASSGPGGTVYGTNLAGNHNTDECSWIDTPALPGVLLATDPFLRFSHWHNIYAASVAGNAWNGAAVFASGDNGATWRYLDLPEYNLNAAYPDLKACLKGIDPGVPATPRVFSGAKESMDDVTVDLSAFTTSETVKVRFVFGAGIAINRAGWYIDDVEVAGVPLLPQS